MLSIPYSRAIISIQRDFIPPSGVFLSRTGNANASSAEKIEFSTKKAGDILHVSFLCLSLHSERHGALAHLARAFDWQSKGGRFESCMLH